MKCVEAQGYSPPQRESSSPQRQQSRGRDTLGRGGDRHPNAAAAEPGFVLTAGIKSIHPSSLNNTFQQTGLGAGPGKAEGSGRDEQWGEEKQSQQD